MIVILYFCLCSDYYSTSDPPTKPYKPIPMSCCAARYSVDNRWYRARIKRYSSGRQFDLLFVKPLQNALDTTVELVYLDYGNNEERHIDELRSLNPAFTRLPAQAICAALEVECLDLNYPHLKQFIFV